MRSHSLPLPGDLARLDWAWPWSRLCLVVDVFPLPGGAIVHVLVGGQLVSVAATELEQIS